MYEYPCTRCQWAVSLCMNTSYLSLPCVTVSELVLTISYTFCGILLHISKSLQTHFTVFSEKKGFPEPVMNKNWVWMTEKQVTDRRGLWKPPASWTQWASLARATFPPRWKREQMSLESPFYPQTFFVCNCTRADGSFPWKVWWSTCRWLGSKRCWWAE